MAYGLTEIRRAPAPPFAPLGLTATANGPHEIDLTCDGCPLAQRYEFQRSANGLTGWSTIATVLAPAYANTGLSALTGYFYRVRGVNAAGSGLWSSTASATTPAIPPNGLSNGLSFYWKALSASTAAGPSPLDVTGPVTFDTAGAPVSGEGYAALAGTLEANAHVGYGAHAAFSNLGTGDFLLSAWLRYESLEESGAFPGLVSIGETGADGFDASFDGLDFTPPALQWELPCADQSYPFLSDAALTAPAAQWNHVLFWWTASDRTMHAQTNGGTVVTHVAGADGGADSNALNSIGTSVGSEKIGSIGLWKGTIPDADGRALLGAGTPYADFTA